MNDCGIYKYVHDGEVIYIGKSDASIDARISAHAKESKFQPYLEKADIYYTLCKNPAHTTILETYLINKYKPRLNVSLKYDDNLGFEIPEPKWVLYQEELQQFASRTIGQLKKSTIAHYKSQKRAKQKIVLELERRIKALSWIEELLTHEFYKQDVFEVEVPLDIESRDDTSPFILDLSEGERIHLWNFSGVAHCYPNRSTIIREFSFEGYNDKGYDFWNDYPLLFEKSRRNYLDEANRILSELKCNRFAIVEGE